MNDSERALTWAATATLYLFYGSLYLLVAAGIPYVLDHLGLRNVIILVGLIVAAAFGLKGAAWLLGRDNLRRKSKPAEWHIDDKGVTVFEVGGEGRKIEVPYSSLKWVAIETTADGPFAEDFFYLLHDGIGTLSVPLGVACEHDLLEHLQRLPGFDSSQVIAASGSTQPATFLCWDREPPHD